MSIPQRSKLLHSLRIWKEKAIARREQVEALKKRVVELTQSRDAWKMKAQARQAMIADLQAANLRLTHASNVVEKKSPPNAIVITSRPFRPWSP